MGHPAARWTVVISEASRLRVRVIATRHRWFGLDHGACLMRHARRRGGGYVLLVSDDLSAAEAADAALWALSAVSQRAWRAWSEGRRGA